MRIVAGQWRGRSLAAPAGQTTRPTSERMRQALFDMLAHAPWAAGCLQGAEVLDGFAGTGALGLEALSRGAARAHFLERDRAALAALRANIESCQAGARATVHATDALRPPRGTPCGLIFLDPPYGQNLVPASLAALDAAGWIAPGALVVAETAASETLDLPAAECVAERSHGAARTSFWRRA
jgi:16S rRNA (guanine966-N2)-methyltransferase